MPIEYRLVRRGLPGDSTTPKKWYANVRARGAPTAAARRRKVKVNFVPNASFEPLLAAAVLHRAKTSTPTPKPDAPAKPASRLPRSFHADQGLPSCGCRATPPSGPGWPGAYRPLGNSAWLGGRARKSPATGRVQSFLQLR